MKKTYATTLPDHVGAFLQACRIFSDLGMNITRSSYNKAIDSNMLFIDAVGTEAQHEEAGKRLFECGYLQPDGDRNVILAEFTIKDEPGGIISILELIRKYSINISYISSQEDGSGFQRFKMGLFVDNHDMVDAFLKEADTICRVKVIDYNRSKTNFDNSIFYNSFVGELTDSMGLGEDARRELIINTNLAMQNLDERGLSPYQTFDNISRFAGLLAAARGEGFNPRISRHRLSEKTSLTLIEPPCGSNTAILRSDDSYLFIDCGHSCYREEMLRLFDSLIPGFESIKKSILITHADLDHCGLLNEFDEVFTNSKSAESLKLGFEGKDDFREINPLHKPYVRICKTLTSYDPVEPGRLNIRFESPEKQDSPLVQIGFFDFADLHFEVYQGAGGHLPGEMVLIDYDNRIVFPGDIYVNLKDMTPEQSEYNRCAPILMTSVDTNPALCAKEREAIFGRLGAGSWKIFGAHGAVKEITVGQLRPAK